MKLIAIRHLPTVFNHNGILQGTINNPIVSITKEVNELILANKKVINSQKFDCVITSEYTRTHQTAKVYGYNDFIIEPLTNELNFGEFEGSSKKIFLERYSHEWMNDIYKIPLGESINDFEIRIKNFLKKYKSKKNLLLFSHGAFLRALYAIIRYNDINMMNKTTFQNNQLIKLNYGS